MKLCIPSFLLILSLLLIVGCGGDSNNNTVVVQQGDIFGTVKNKETGVPIKGASVQIGAKMIQTDDNGKYMLKEIPFSNNLEIVVTAQEYKEYHDFVSLQQELLSFDVKLIPTQSPSTQILTVLSSISKDIESLDATKIPDIQSHFSKTYVAGDDEATAFGIFAGVVPPDYKSIPDIIDNIIKKYTKLSFEFVNPDVQFSGDSASIIMRFMVNAETKPPDPKKWEIVIDGKMTFQKQDNSWKVTFWGLISPFIKFVENPI